MRKAMSSPSMTQGPANKKKFSEFFKNNKDNLLTSEFLIPDVLTNLVEEKKASTKVINTSSVWHGVTYKEDTKEVKDAICNLVNNKEYKVIEESGTRKYKTGEKILTEEEFYKQTNITNISFNQDGSYTFEAGGVKYKSDKEHNQSRDV